MYDVVMHKWFENFVMINVVVNTVAMSCKYYQMPLRSALILSKANLYFSLVFNVEMFSKIYALRRTYFD